MTFPPPDPTDRKIAPIPDITIEVQTVVDWAQWPIRHEITATCDLCGLIQRTSCVPEVGYPYISPAFLQMHRDMHKHILNQGDHQ